MTKAQASTIPTRDTRSLVAFFLMAFGLTWGIAVLFVLFTKPLEAVFGPMSNSNVLFRLAVFSPTTSAIIVMAWFEGWSGAKRLLSGLVRWRVGLGWYAFVLLFVPALGVLGAVLGGSETILAARGWPALFSLAAVQLLTDPGGLGEELGWRGFALPRLRT